MFELHERHDGWVKAYVAGMILAQRLLDEIIEHCRRMYPREACGLIAGSGNRAEKVYRLTNVAKDPLTRYLVDPEEQLAAFRSMRRAGQRLVAIYHSHPRTAAYPSETDIQKAFYPDAYYVIVSLAEPAPDVQTFRIDGPARRVCRVPLHIQDDNS